MNTFAFLVLCVQLCLFQNAYSQCIQPAVAPVYNIPSCASALIPAYAPACTPAYASPSAYAPAAYAVTIPSSCGCRGGYY